MTLNSPDVIQCTHAHRRVQWHIGEERKGADNTWQKKRTRGAFFLLSLGTFSAHTFLDTSIHGSAPCMDVWELQHPLPNDILLISSTFKNGAPQAKQCAADCTPQHTLSCYWPPLGGPYCEGFVRSGQSEVNFADWLATVEKRGASFSRCCTPLDVHQIGVTLTNEA